VRKEGDENMKKLIILPILLLLFITVFQVSPVYAASSGYERYKDDKCEIYLEYFPIVPTA